MVLHDRLSLPGRREVRGWLVTSVAATPSWAWSAVAAVVVGACAAAVPLGGDMGRQPDAGVWTAPSSAYGDYALFVRAGGAILSGDLGHAYSDPTVQTGPLALVWAAALALVLHVLHGSATFGFFITVVATLTPTLYAVARWASRFTPPRWLYVVAVGGLVVLLIPWQLASLIAYQHPTYLWVPTLWLLAADAARRRRPTTTALLLVTACALETWSVLAVPVLLLALPTWRNRLRAAMTWTVATGAVWAPFVLSGDFRMFDMTWHSTVQTPILALWGDPATVTWPIRATQAAVVVVAGIVTWLVGRTTTDAATVAVAVVAWVRLATDVQMFPYYRLPLFATTVALTLAAAARYLSSRRRQTLPTLGVSGLMLSMAQSEAFAIPMLANAAVHASVLAGLVGAARCVPAAPEREDPTTAEGSSATTRSVGRMRVRRSACGPRTSR